ncbi:transposase [Nostoc calcicola FACHB-3891]|nr:transposase [Nostoc calcicola FACHB-3891]
MNLGLNEQVRSIILIPNVANKNQLINPVEEAEELVFLVFGSRSLRFEYGAVVGGFNSERYLQLLEWQAHLAQQRLEQTGQITVIIQDGASFHRSKKVQQHWQRWQQQGLYIFFLPPYSPQMNRIEDQWLHLKRDELSSQIFEDEYELA